MQPNKWKSVLQLDPGRKVIGGSSQALVDAIRRGADLRIRTDFHHNEHIDTTSSNAELIVETSEFRVTYLIDNRWAAGMMTLRQPVVIPEGLGPRPSMSLFMYNQDGNQAIARIYLDGPPVNGGLGSFPPTPPVNMPKYHAIEAWDTNSNGPSMNFIYDFDIYEFFVRDDWEEMLHADAKGNVVSGSVRELTDAFRSGRDVKVGVRGLCADLAGTKSPLDHEVFVQTGFNYYYTDQELFTTETHPLPRVRPAIPMQYKSKGWDFAWLFLRTDGFVQTLLYDPYTLQPSKFDSHLPIRWFVR
ncbi:MAG: hypothetical protein OK456_10620 [Thaumarchaeota archaeon]|nr:hypothetical protein [Nitrososphaerota archaeon]